MTMHKLEQIADDIRKSFDLRTKMRDEALGLTRQLTRACSLAIRAVHRDDKAIWQVTRICTTRATPRTR
jgi:predicted translin family RNA/ssDNA-binding protein